MLPKSGRIIVFLWLTLTVTQSLALTQCKSFKTLGETLQYFNLPPALFPDNVESFSCTPIAFGPGAPTGLDLVVRLRGGTCTVTRELLRVTNVVICQQQISASITYNLLYNIKGVTVKLSASSPPFGPFDLALVLDRVKVIQLVSLKIVQFLDTTGISSPPFPVALFPPQPPSCDKTNSAAANVVAQAGDSQDTPSWVSDNYGRILPVVAA